MACGSCAAKKAAARLVMSEDAPPKPKRVKEEKDPAPKGARVFVSNPPGAGEGKRFATLQQAKGWARANPGWSVETALL